MIELRLAQEGDIFRLKDIWERCFGDPRSFIDFYFSNRYIAEETAVLLYEGVLASMLTMIPVQTVTPDQDCLKTAMLYAIATHPEYQNRGLAKHLINFSHQVLREKGFVLSVLVPASNGLFGFYRKLEYEAGFFIREMVLTREQVDQLTVDLTVDCSILPITPHEYNLRRNQQLSGRLFIGYNADDLDYQKKISQGSGADLYAMDFVVKGTQNLLASGCATVERIDTQKVVLKELLLPEISLGQLKEEFPAKNAREMLINIGLKQLAQQLPAKEWIVRTPSYTGEAFGRATRPFGMYKALKESSRIVTPGEFGYLGLAFD